MINQSINLINKEIMINLNFNHSEESRLKGKGNCKKNKNNIQSNIQ